MEELIKKCKCSVHLEVNKHRDYYNTIEDAIKEAKSLYGDDEIDTELAERMIKEDMFISLQFYPDTPIGFHKVYGTSIDEVVKKALTVFE